MSTEQRRAIFDFEIEFTNGGSLQGRNFRLDITGDDVSDQALANAIVADLRLLMVGPVRIRNKRIVAEPHKRNTLDQAPAGDGRLVDLSHTIFDGLRTYKGLPPPVICDYLSREDSRARYEPGTEFQIGKIELVTNTGTYLDCPFHRYADGADLADTGLDALADLEGVVVRADYRAGLAIDVGAFQGLELRNRAVLVHTGWSEHWNTDRYFEDHPFLTAAAAAYLKACGVRLVGIDSHNIDDTRGRSRPVHTELLGAGTLIVEHLTNLASLPDQGFSFSAVPPKIEGAGTFPVRAFARCR
jgi:arylformamidase